MSTLDRLALGDLSPVIRRIVLVPNPAATAEFSVAVPGDQVWRVLAVNAVLTTTPAAANRQPSLNLTDGTNRAATFGMTSNVPSNSGTVLSWVAGIGAAQSGTFSPFVTPLPIGFTMPPGYVLTSVTSGLQAGDQYSTVTLWIDQGVAGVNPWDLERRAIEDVVDEPTAFL